VASGVNNQVARVAALLAIAVVGAVVAARFEAVLDERTADRGAAVKVAVADTRPLSREADGRLGDQVVREASVSAYRAGMLVGGAFVIVGGLISLLGIANAPRRSVGHV